MRPFPTRPRVAGPPSRRAPVLTLATALVVTLLGSAAPGAAAAPAAGAAGPSPSAQPEAAAKATAEAKRTGKRVEITSQRTENEEVWANPDGSLSSDRALVPIRVYQSGRLVPVDTALAKAKDGRIAPKATRSELTFSGGGDAPLATLRKDGRDVALTWPRPLPAPTLDGDTATYAEVLKGVDLRITANAIGFSHQLVVKNREAAANPALASLDFGIKGNGVTVRKEENGELKAVDSAGQTLFSSAKPQMWDSGADQSPAPATGAAPADGASAKNAKKAPGAAAPAARTPSGEKAPTARGERVPAVGGISLGTKEADLGVELKGDRLTLTTDRKLLTAPDTVFPVVIDPVWRDDWKSAWTIAYKHNGYPESPSTNYWNGGTLTKEARVGCARDGVGGPVVCAKTFFQIPMGELGGKQILDATLRIKQNYAGSWGCKSGDIQVWDTDGISGATTWNNQPRWKRMVDASGQSFGGRNCPGDGDLVELNVTSAVADAARWNWPAWTFGLKSANDTVDVSYRRLNPDSARISTRFNTLPNYPYDRSSDPYVPCEGGQIGTTDQVVLRARISDAEDNSLHAEFNYWKEDDYSGTIKRPWVAVASGGVATLRIPASELTGSRYRWDVKGVDEAGSGPWAGQCVFGLDKSRPGELPGISSVQFPEDLPGVEEETSYARTPGTFTFSANGVNDVTRFEWYTAGDPTVRTVNATTTGGTAQITYTPLAAGPHALFVRSLDAAGNRSDTKPFHFNAKRPAERDKHGDVNGDGAVDIWSVDPGDGRLWLVPGKGGGAFGVPRQTPYGNFANAVSTSQWGSWNGGDSYEDLLVLRPKTGDPNKNGLYVYRGDGGGGIEDPEQNAGELTAGEGMRHWETGQQVLAISSVNDDTKDGKIDEADQADLLVLSGANLWLYFGRQAGGNLTARDNPPVLLGNADWAGMTLSAPGDLNGDSLPEIWARDKATGKIHQYTSRKTTDATAKAAIDLAVYADPAVRAASIGAGFTSTAWQHLSSLGDFEKDGYPDLWSRDTSGVISEFQGRALAGGSAFGPARQIATSGTPWTTCEDVSSAVSTGKHKLCGPILAKFKAKGGTAWAKPSMNVTDTSDGGKYVNLRVAGAGSDHISVYWHPSTGAWVVMNGIREKWISLGGERGFLGYPTSDEDKTFDEVGVFTTFRGSGGNGAVYWSPELGSWSVHGTIYAKYIETGGPGGWLGYPTTDEIANTDNKGRYNHFRHRSQTSDTASIYWASGSAWSVRGTIRQKWMALGAEKSFLGYPRSDEYDVYGGPREDFENGYIRHNRTTGVSVEHKPDDRTDHLRTELAGDFNGDGRADLATVYDFGSDDTALYLMAGLTDGGFGPPRLAFETGRGNWRYAASKWVAGDFNGDGRDDLAALYDYSGGANGMFSFLGQADGTFKDTPRSAYVPAGSWEPGKAKLVAGDFNGDKREDVAFFYDHGGSTGAHTFLSKADGTFNPSTPSWRSAQGGWNWNESQQVAGDFNGDGRDDILAVYGQGNGTVTAHTLLGRADGGFADPKASWNRPTGTWEYNKSRFTSGDYNGDGRADLAIMYDYTAGRGALFTLLGKADGGVAEDFMSWSGPQGTWEAGKAGRPVSGDVDNDGRDDIAVMYTESDGGTSANTFKARTDGGFESPLKSWQSLAGIF
ncbi:FG-GAP-like repeat-containing protein [Streptomyces subrutilus]|uniref:FG-GAP-like repeat-containing protein n=1 Tax=Streptomyces subrutilus TaxID=36818 RepID=UPI002E0D8A28|nr:FG-GAP-like repeat-containing protein [Streptomyces subrutilus]